MGIRVSNFLVTVSIAVGFFMTAGAVAFSNELCPKFGNCVPEAAFDCRIIDRSSLVTRVCYSAEKRYMIVRLEVTDYHYCEIGPEVVAAFLAAPSMGRFYNQSIKDSGTGGLFSCRDRPVPAFND